MAGDFNVGPSCRGGSSTMHLLAIGLLLRSWPRHGRWWGA